MPTAPPIGRAKWAAIGFMAGAAAIGLAWSVANTPASPHSPLVPASDSAGSRPAVISPDDRPAAPAFAASPHTSDDSPAAASAPATAAHLIDLNTASAAELQTLPRIGPALSARIIEDRRANGPFKSLEDLDRVYGIGPATVARLRGLATAGDGTD